MTLDPAEVQHVAMLARLGLDEEESARIGGELDRILDHIRSLETVDTSAVGETAQVGVTVNRWRDDVPDASMSQRDALANAPEVDGQYFRVGAIQE